MRYRELLFVGLLWVSCGIVAETAPGAEGERRPNVLWIIAENMGPDLGCYGAPLVRTPNVDGLAGEGMRYVKAFATSPVCSSSRSAFMTGMYQTSIGAHNHRSHRRDRFCLPGGVRPVTHWLRDAGYYTANVHWMGGKRIGTGKTDLNFKVAGDAIHAKLRGSGSQDHNQRNEIRLFHTDDWDELRKHQPFYAQVNLPVVELGPEGWVGSRRQPAPGDQIHPSIIHPQEVKAPPYYPDHAITRREWSGYLNAVCDMDRRVGEILDRLAADGLAEDTVVVFFSDNGRLEVRGLDWCYDSGDRVPLIIRWPRSFPSPRGYRAGEASDRLVSLLDLTATTLAIAGIDKPAKMESRVFLGSNSDPPRRFVISARDRCDEAVNRIRALRTDRYRYIRNFMPDKPYMALHRYKEASYPVIALMRRLHREGKLNAIQQQLMVSRLPDEELYLLEDDPYEIHNLAGSSSPRHQRILKQLRGELNRWIEETDDQGRYPESPEVIRYWTQEQHERHGTPAWYKPGR